MSDRCEVSELWCIRDSTGPARRGLLVGSTSVQGRLCLQVSGHSGTCRVDRRGEGGEVAGGIDVAIHCVTAHIAPKHANMQWQLGFHRTAVRAGFAGGVPAVGHHQVTSAPADLVVELSPNLAEAGIRDTAGKSPVAQHPGHMQILDHDHSDASCQTSSELMKSIATQIDYSMVDPVASAVCHAPALRWFLTGALVWPAAPRHSPRVSSQSALGGCHMPRVAHHAIGVGQSRYRLRQHGQMRDSNVETDHRARLGRTPHEPLNFAGERTPPAARLKPDRRGQNPCGSRFESTSQFSGGFKRLDPAQPWQCDVMPIGLNTDRAGGESARHPAATLGFESWKPNPPTLTIPTLRFGPVPQSRRELGEASRIGFLRALSPPWGYQVFGAVPGATQCWQRPGQCGGERARWDSVRDFRSALVRHSLDQSQTPVECDPGRAAMPSQFPDLPRGRVQCKPIRLELGHRIACICCGRRGVRERLDGNRMHTLDRSRTLVRLRHTVRRNLRSRHLRTVTGVLDRPARHDEYAQPSSSRSEKLEIN